MSFFSDVGEKDHYEELFTGEDSKLVPAHLAVL